MGTDAQGSFNVIAYCDPTGSNSWENGKILIVYNIVMVLATVRNNTNSVQSTSNNFSVQSNLGGYEFYTGTSQNPPIRFGTGSFEVLFEGGGANAKIGLLNQFGILDDKVLPGWLGNVVSISAKALYANGKYEYATVVPGTIPPQSPTSGLPLLDTVAAGTGGESSFRATSLWTLKEPVPSRGLLYAVSAKDAPIIGFDKGFPTDVDKLIVSVSGGMGFKDYITYFSKDFDKSFTVIGKVEWSFTYAYSYNSQNSSWTNNGSTVTAPTAADLTGFPLSAASAGAITLGPPKCPDALHKAWTQ